MPSDDYVQNVQRLMSEARDTLLHAYVVEIGDTIKRTADGVSRIEDGFQKMQVNTGEASTRFQAKDELELRNKLLPPSDSLHYGKQVCLAGTRVSVIENIRSWATDSETSSRLFWVHGVAGCGKSLLAASVAKVLGVQLMGSFFCKRDQDERRSPVRLIWTIAFYLADPQSPCHDALLTALQKPDAFVNQDITSQFETFIEEPLNAVEYS